MSFQNNNGGHEMDEATRQSLKERAERRRSLLPNKKREDRLQKQMAELYERVAALEQTIEQTTVTLTKQIADLKGGGN
jgi:septal ring factor EnvC (AmiA/AmiB activator)